MGDTVAPAGSVARSVALALGSLRIRTPAAVTRRRAPISWAGLPVGAGAALSVAAAEVGADGSDASTDADADADRPEVVGDPGAAVQAAATTATRTSELTRRLMPGTVEVIDCGRAAEQP
jgi:hypothetical protein